MNRLVEGVNRILGYNMSSSIKLPYALGFLLGKGFDFVARLTGKKFAISSIRVKKFCADSVYSTAINDTGFIPPVQLEQALLQTVRYEFLERREHDVVFYTE
jgi:hypothetical protein